MPWPLSQVIVPGLAFHDLSLRMVRDLSSNHRRIPAMKIMSKTQGAHQPSPSIHCQRIRRQIFFNQNIQRHIRHLCKAFEFLCTMAALLKLTTSFWACAYRLTSACCAVVYVADKASFRLHLLDLSSKRAIQIDPIPRNYLVCQATTTSKQAYLPVHCYMSRQKPLFKGLGGKHTFACNYEANPMEILYIRQLLVNSMSRAFNLLVLVHCVVATPCA